MTRIFADYVERARGILEDNWTGRFTKPAPSLYPHQWNWDSGFIAIGKSYYDTSQARQEIETLFEAQWSNGMVPQIVFDPDELGHYFPEPDFWRTERSSFAPQNKMTSGITMPPVHAIAVEKIHQNARKPRRVLPFLRKIYPKLIAQHEYLYRERDPEQEGLVYIRHPWESGIDNSPTWDVPLKRIKIDKEKLPEYTRRDLEHGVDPNMRPSGEDYDRYVFLVDLFRQNDYDESRIKKNCPFLIQDPLFNAILCRANESLARIAEIIGESPDLPRSWIKKTAAAIRGKLWHKDHGIFDAYDLVAGKLIEIDTAAGFIPLLAGAPTREQAQTLYDHLNSASFCALHQGNCYTIPNYDTQKEDFDRINYWRGPVWININWMLAQGLRRYGYTLKADSLQKDLLQLPIRFGFHEYFDSFDGTGYGSNNFSWTAALFIGLVEEFYESPEFKIDLKKTIRKLFPGDLLLNDGEEMPDVDSEDIGAELMRCIRRLRDKYYDTKRGLVDYESLRQGPDFQTYRRLTNGLKNFDPAGLVGGKEKLAFWINLYNTIVVDGIITLGIKDSVKEAPELFQKIKYKIGEFTFSPDDIEHGILRGNVRHWLRLRRPFVATDPRRAMILAPVDPRIHFALVCGSRSCAPIDYYDAEKIFEQLDKASRSFVNSSEVIVLPEEGKILISEIFHWYMPDFRGRSGVLGFIHDYLADDRAREFIGDKNRTIQTEYLHYDWNLNRGA